MGEGNPHKPRTRTRTNIGAYVCTAISLSPAPPPRRRTKAFIIENHTALRNDHQEPRRAWACALGKCCSCTPPRDTPSGVQPAHAKSDGGRGRMHVVCLSRLAQGPRLPAIIDAYIIQAQAACDRVRDALPVARPARGALGPITPAHRGVPPQQA